MLGNVPAKINELTRLLENQTDTKWNVILETEGDVTSKLSKVGLDYVSVVNDHIEIKNVGGYLSSFDHYIDELLKLNNSLELNCFKEVSGAVFIRQPTPYLLLSGLLQETKEPGVYEITDPDRFYDFVIETYPHQCPLEDLDIARKVLPYLNQASKDLFDEDEMWRITPAGIETSHPVSAKYEYSRQLEKSVDLNIQTKSYDRPSNEIQYSITMADVTSFYLQEWFNN